PWPTRPSSPYRRSRPAGRIRWLESPTQTHQAGHALDLLSDVLLVHFPAHFKPAGEQGETLLEEGPLAACDLVIRDSKHDGSALSVRVYSENFMCRHCYTSPSCNCSCTPLSPCMAARNRVRTSIQRTPSVFSP